MSPPAQDSEVQEDLGFVLSGPAELPPPASPQGAASASAGEPVSTQAGSVPTPPLPRPGDKATAAYTPGHPTMSGDHKTTLKNSSCRAMVMVMDSIMDKAREMNR